mmetsp:Transcript_3677/g.7143  ORF Transcript_3677/g.7143 Transcript_3677/m.7143 type:complete len:266 (-) Transcript_3677:889-1686(-)
MERARGHSHVECTFCDDLHYRQACCPQGQASFQDADIQRTGRKPHQHGATRCGGFSEIWLRRPSRCASCLRKRVPKPARSGVPAVTNRANDSSPYDNGRVRPHLLARNNTERGAKPKPDPEFDLAGHKPGHRPNNGPRTVDRPSSGVFSRCRYRAQRRDLGRACFDLGKRGAPRVCFPVDQVHILEQDYICRGLLLYAGDLGHFELGVRIHSQHRVLARSDRRVDRSRERRNPYFYICTASHRTVLYWRGDGPERFCACVEKCLL